MAKVKGALFSMDASGAYAGALVFTKWKGRQVVRQLVTPSNPRSSGQETARNRVRVTGAIQKWVNATTLKQSGQTQTDKQRIMAATPGGYAWNGYLNEVIIGAGGITYAAAVTAWNALQAAEKTAWTTAAEALTPAMTAVVQMLEGGIPTTNLPAGEVFFIYQYGLSTISLAPTPTATPPTYA